MKPKFKRGDILEHQSGIGYNVKITGVDTKNGIGFRYDFHTVTFVDGEWVSTHTEFPANQEYVERNYKLSTKATRHEFIKDILK